MNTMYSFFVALSYFGEKGREGKTTAAGEGAKKFTNFPLPDLVRVGTGDGDRVAKHSFSSFL